MKNGWRSMDSAPKDGTRVLLWVESGCCFIGQYKDQDECFWAAFVVKPTAWQPLPGSPDGGNE